MVMASIHLPRYGSNSINAPAAKANAPTSTTAALRGSFRCVVTASAHTSNILMRLVIPAKITERKNSTAMKRPPGICANTLGSVMRMSGGPDAGSMPKANTAGRMAKPASRAAQVSSSAVCMAARGISSFLER